jgi:hypothetical protein
MNDRAPDLMEPVVSWCVATTADGPRLESLTRHLCWPVVIDERRLDMLDVDPLAVRLA